MIDFKKKLRGKYVDMERLIELMNRTADYSDENVIKMYKVCKDILNMKAVDCKESK